ncbi:MAG: hypothetical protein ACK56F_16445 [bacterium]
MLDCRIALATESELALGVRAPGKDLCVPLIIELNLIVFLLLPAREACVRHLLCNIV